MNGARKLIVMVGTSLDTMGGIAAVASVYAGAGLFQRFPVRYLVSHRDGGAAVKWRAMLGAYLRFAALLARGRVGLLHVHVASHASVWRKSGFLLAAFLLRIPTIFHLHGGGFATFYERDCNRAQRWLIRLLLAHASRVLVLSRAFEAWVKLVSAAARVELLFNPVRVPPGAPDWEARRRTDLLFLGKIARAKGVYDLLEAARLLAARRPGLRLLLGGEGALAAVRGRADALCLGARVALLGWVDGPAKQALLARAGIYALPSYAECMPMSVLEAMAAGLPIVATTVGGIPDAVTDGVEGFLVAPGDVGALAERIERLLDDAGLARRMGAAARRKAETCFSCAAVLPRIERIYTELGCAPP